MMNEKDLLLFNQLKEQLGDPPQPGPVVLDIKTTQFVRVELVLLKVLIGEGRPGLFISVDRPHQYMVHLLGMHQIDHSKMTFLDAVARFASDQKQVAVNVGFLRGPNNIDTLPEALNEWSSGNKNEHGFNLDECRFAMIDNLATLLNYNSQQVVEKFLTEFVRSLGNKVTIPLIVDKERNLNLFEMVTALGGKQLQVDALNQHVERPRLKIIDDNVSGGIN